MMLRSFLVLLMVGFAPCVALATPQAIAAQAEAETSVDEPAVEGDGVEAEDHSEGDHAEGDHGGAHDSDPTHGNMSDAAQEVVDFRTDIALFTAVVFVLLLTALYSTAWKPIMMGLEKRERRIAGSIAHAEKVAAEADAKLAEYEAKLAAAAHEATQIVAEARKDGEAAGQKLVASAQEDATRLKERALSDIESAKRVALGELATQSSDIAIALAKRVVGHEVRAEDHQSMIQEMLSKLPSNN